MLRSRSHKISVAGLFVALGLILPYATSHAFGIPGTLLLPMHIPVLLCGLLCGAQLGAACGLIVPVLSSLLTGMPPAYPMLPIMAVQLVVLGLLGGLLYEKKGLNIYLSLIISMAAGWAAYGLVYGALLFAAEGPFRALSVTAAVVQGLPGMAVQLALIPAVVVLLKKYLPAGRKSGGNQMEKNTAFEEAVKLISNEGTSCVVLQNGVIVHTADGRGVSPLLRLYENNPALFKGAVVVDRIIGKAAAMILVLGGVSGVYGDTMSRSAENYLKARGIETGFNRCVDVISNREKNGICPIERSVLDTDDPQKGLEQIKETVKVLMRAAM